jgi:hypothetical protein
VVVATGPSQWHSASEHQSGPNDNLLMFELRQIDANATARSLSLLGSESKPIFRIEFTNWPVALPSRINLTLL